MERVPVASGQFYPNDPSDLKAIIEDFRPQGSLPLRKCSNPLRGRSSPLRGCSKKISAKGIVLPHAGYVYSGRVAVNTISKVLPKKRLLILGPNHTGQGGKFSLWSRGSWKILDKKIKIDEELARAILSKGKNIDEDTLAHTLEHSIEVELPILDYFFSDFKFVPIACQKGTILDYQEAAKGLFEAIKSLRNPEDILLVASTDLTHYESDQAARKKDRRAIETIIDLDEEELVKRVRKEGITLCGEAPLAIFISCLKRLGARKSQVALYQTSGDVTGDKNAVVGYVGMIIQ